MLYHVETTSVLSLVGETTSGGSVTPPVVAFNPLDYSPALWLDGSASSTMFNQLVGGSVVSAGGDVYRWEDKSGTGNHALASDGVYPTRQVNQQNGLDSVRFTANYANFKGTATGFPVSNSPRTTVVVSTRTTSTGNQITFSYGNSGEKTPWLHYIEAANNRGGLNRADATSLLGPHLSAVPMMTILRETDTPSRLITGRTNTTVLAPNLSVQSNTVLEAFGYQVANWRNFGSYQFKGQVHEIMVFPSALSDATILSMENYLIAKWGIVI